MTSESLYLAGSRGWFARSRHLAGMTLVLSVAVAGGCQLHPVEIRSTGRTIAFNDVRHTQQTADMRLSRVPARLDIEEWRYAASDPHEAPASQPAGDASVTSSELPLVGQHDEYVWDAGHQRMSMRSTALPPKGDAGQVFDESARPTRRVVVQRTPEGDELRAELNANQITLERVAKSEPTRAYHDTVLKHALENDLFFEMADQWYGKFEAARENGLDLVKVSWSAMGVDTIEWFRPDQGFRLHRKETRDLQKRLRSRIIADEFRNVSGFPYPFLYEVTTWDNWEAKRIVDMVRYVVRSADFAATVTDEDFMIDVPQGATVVMMTKQPSLLPGTGTMSTSTRSVSAMRADIKTLFALFDEAASQPADAPETQPKP